MFTSLLDDRVRVARGFLAPERAAALFAELLRATPWLAVRYENAGAPVDLPRLTVNYGERSYDYSGLVFTPLPWTPLLAELRAQVEPPAQASFNALIVQLYRDGRDGVSWHADDSPGLGVDPVIASLSFGATRRFEVRARDLGARADFGQLDPLRLTNFFEHRPGELGIRPNLGGEFGAGVGAGGGLGTGLGGGFNAGGGAERIHRRPVDLPRPPPDVRHDREPRHPPGDATRNPVRRHPVEARHLLR